MQAEMQQGGGVTYRCTPLLHMMDVAGPQPTAQLRGHGQQPDSGALQAVLAQAAMRLDLLNEATSR